MQTSGTSYNIPSSASSSRSSSFEGFLQEWNRRQDELVAEITAQVQGKRGGTAGELISRAMGQFNEYYEQKSRAAHQNVFEFFSPKWCSSFEYAFFWITGFRPTLLFQLVSNSIQDLAPHQIGALARLKKTTKTEKKKVTDELARIQENIAPPPFLDVVVKCGGNIDESYFTSNTVKESMEGLKAALQGVVSNADILRMITASKVVEILNEPQCLKFLAAAIQMLQGIRSFGMQREPHARRYI